MKNSIIKFRENLDTFYEVLHIGQQLFAGAAGFETMEELLNSISSFREQGEELLDKAIFLADILVKLTDLTGEGGGRKY